MKMVEILNGEDLRSTYEVYKDDGDHEQLIGMCRIVKKYLSKVGTS